jgi:MoaA/NifB/PqqE/SkfB family radical SAM enzyme
MRLISHPVLCNYYVTYRCNASCSFCDIWERPSPYVTLEQAALNLRDLKKLGVKVVDFTGGEPLLHRQIDKLLELARSLGFITTVTTNGLLYPKLAERLKGKVDMLHFSLDSPVAAEHDAMRGVKCFQAVMDSISIAKSQGERPDILFTVFEHNMHHIRQMWEEICLPNNLVLILNPVFNYGHVETGVSLNNKVLEELLWWSKQKNIYLNEAFISLRQDGGNRIDKPVCRAGSSTVVISPDDELILPCYHLGLEKFPVQGKLYELYRSDKIQQLLKMEGRYNECEGCTINCYMQPSFAVEISKYWLAALPSTLKYNYLKGTWKRLFVN